MPPLVAGIRSFCVAAVTGSPETIKWLAGALGGGLVFDTRPPQWWRSVLYRDIAVVATDTGGTFSVQPPQIRRRYKDAVGLVSSTHLGEDFKRKIAGLVEF